MVTDMKFSSVLKIIQDVNSSRSRQRAACDLGFFLLPQLNGDLCPGTTQNLSSL